MPPIDSVGRPGARDLNVRNDRLPSKPAIAEPFSRGKTEQAPPADGMRRAFNRFFGRDPGARSNGGSNNGSNNGANVGASGQESPGSSGLAARMWMSNMDLSEPVMEQPPPPYSQAAVPQEPPPYSQVVGQQPPQR